MMITDVKIPKGTGSYHAREGRKEAALVLLFFIFVLSKMLDRRQEVMKKVTGKPQKGRRRDECFQSNTALLP